MLCPKCCSIFHGQAPRLNERIGHPFSFEEFRSSLALGCFICCGLRDNFRIDKEAYEIDDINHLIGVREVEYKFEIMGLMNARIRTPCQPKYQYLTVTWECEVDYPGRERWIHQLVQWPIQAVRENEKWNEPSVLDTPKTTMGEWLSDDVVTHVRRWLESCGQDHKTCNQHESTTQSNKFYPSRLIFVGKGNRLVETAEAPLTGPYLTLSHRWPADASVYTQLKQENLSTFKTSIDPADLSRVFQDAIAFTRRLGVEYIWIDSLCIIQDSKEDWERESTTMADIYSQSYCNLSATSDRCQEEGLFHSRHQLQFSHERVATEWIGKPFTADQDTNVSECSPTPFHRQKYVLYDPNFWARRVDHQELFTRGWVFQEQQLAPRILHFSSDQLLWECRQHRACETFPSGLPQNEMGWGESWRSNPAATVIKGALAAVGRDVDGSSFYPTLGLSPWLAWQQVVGHYTRLNLTNAQDALVALAGVARVYQQLYQSNYAAGRWEEDFISSLIWGISTDGHSQNCPSARVQRPEHFRTGTPPYTAPSWSWASVDTAVVGYGARHVPTYTPELIHRCVISSNGDPYGTVIDGYLLWKAPIYPGRLMVNDRFNLKVLVGLLVEGFTSCAWTVDLDMCCRRHPSLQEALKEMESEENSELGTSDDEGSEEDAETDEDSAGQTGGGSEDDDFDPDWDLKTLSKRYPAVFYLPIFEGVVVGESGRPTENRTGLVLEPVEGSRGAYRRIGICFDKSDAQGQWRLPQATGMIGFMKNDWSSGFYLDLREGLVLIV